MFKLISV